MEVIMFKKTSIAKTLFAIALIAGMSTNTIQARNNKPFINYSTIAGRVFKSKSFMFVWGFASFQFGYKTVTQPKVHPTQRLENGFWMLTELKKPLTRSLAWFWKNK